jgi:hypothetical protein
MSYCETAWLLPFAAEGVPSLPAYWDSAFAKPPVLKPAGGFAPADSHEAFGCPATAGAAALRQAAATGITRNLRMKPPIQRVSPSPTGGTRSASHRFKPLGERSCTNSTFASNALAAGISVFELARIMGTSVTTIERVYGTLIEGAGLGIVSRLDAFDAAPERDDQNERALTSTTAIARGLIGG